MAKLIPSLRATDTYTEENFLFLHSMRDPDQSEKVTLEHFSCAEKPATGGSWSCTTIIDAEPMTRDDAVFIAQSYAAANDVPVIYECHAD